MCVSPIASVKLRVRDLELEVWDKLLIWDIAPFTCGQGSGKMQVEFMGSLADFTSAGPEHPGHLQRATAVRPQSKHAFCCGGGVFVQMLEHERECNQPWPGRTSCSPASNRQECRVDGNFHVEQAEWQGACSRIRDSNEPGMPIKHPPPSMRVRVTDSGKKAAEHQVVSAPRTRGTLREAHGSCSETSAAGRELCVPS